MVIQLIGLIPFKYKYYKDYKMEILCRTCTTINNYHSLEVAVRNFIISMQLTKSHVNPILHSYLSFP